MSYFYGPVPSRRLGLSLGVDLLKPKSCNFDCVYCQLGRTKKAVTKRFSHVDIADFKQRLVAMLAKHPDIDYVTFSGSGEPTLHKYLNKFIAAVKHVGGARLKVCVITNSCLLGNTGVRKELLGADVIVPSLDAVTQDLFIQMNNPPAGVTVGQIIKGLIRLRKEFKGTLWLEIMLIKGVNDSIEHALELKKVIEKINPDKIQLNVPVRPAPWSVADFTGPAHTCIEIPDVQRLRMFQKILGARAEIMGAWKRRSRREGKGVSERDVLNLVLCHPSTQADVCYALGISDSVCRQISSRLVKQGKVIWRMTHGKKYMVAV